MISFWIRLFMVNFNIFLRNLWIILFYFSKLYPIIRDLKCNILFFIDMLNFDNQKFKSIIYFFFFHSLSLNQPYIISLQLITADLFFTCLCHSFDCISTNYISRFIYYKHLYIQGCKVLIYVRLTKKNEKYCCPRVSRICLHI